MKRIISISAIVLLTASMGYAGGFEELRAAAGEDIRAMAVEIPEPVAGFAKADGLGAVRLFITTEGGIKASASAVYSARTNSYFCTEYSWNEGSGGRVPKRIYPQFAAQNGLITIPGAMDSSCDYRRVNEGSLSLSIPGRAEAYNSIAVLMGGSGGAEQRVECKVIMVDGPKGAAGEKLSCYGDIRLDADNKANVRVVTLNSAGSKLVPEKAAAGTSRVLTGTPGAALVEFGRVCRPGRNQKEALNQVLSTLNQPFINLQIDASVWTAPTETGTYLQAPYRIIGEVEVTKRSWMLTYDWEACISVQGRVR